jgi:hypothetical protein
MNNVIHMQTTIQTIFAVLDDEGNAIPQKPIVVQIHNFSEASVIEARQAIIDERDKIIDATKKASSQKKM